jgi:geranylgeranyl diphosphate synthase type I
VANPSPHVGVAFKEPPGAIDVAAAVDELLKAFVAEEAQALRRLSPELEPLIDAVTAAVLAGGKRLRPAFGYWGWRAVAGPAPSPDPVLPALAALELLHAFALVHDDIMDRSSLRRGEPTVHRALAAVHGRRGLRGSPEHYGVSTAILVGDLCLVWADILMSMASVPARSLLRARAGYDRMRAETIAGQFLDVQGEASTEWTLGLALRTAQLKTARYTVTRPLLFGATLAASAEPGLRQAFEHYGDLVGVAFQLRDDLLGLYGDPSTLGKPVGEDLRAGKPTVVLELARLLADPGQLAELRRIRNASNGFDVERAVRVIEETGAVRRVEDLIARKLEIAYDALDGAPMHDCAREPLARLAAAAAWRTA